jgi:branched-chain amino acid transport system ATP-binding protein
MSSDERLREEPGPGAPKALALAAATGPLGVGSGHDLGRGKTAAPALEARTVHAGYDGIPVLRDVSLSVAPGEVVALIGANGSGKTTTLLTLAGEVPLQSGEVRWQGAKAHGSLHRRARSGLGLLTEERSLFMTLTVRQNLRLGRGRPEDALELMPELKELTNRRAGLLSGGQQQMLTLARALAGDFKVLMIDEISLGLAPIIVRRLLALVRKAATERKLGVLLVEQQVGSALTFSDRAIVLRQGQVVLEGESARLRERVDEIASAYL